MAKNCKVTWLQMHNMNDVDLRERERFLVKVSRTLRKLG